MLSVCVGLLVSESDVFIAQALSGGPRELRDECVWRGVGRHSGGVLPALLDF